jgi:uncharacterized membrane protein YjjP (DUF1212 family)
MNGLMDELAVAEDAAKKAYIERVWQMTKGELFNEVMRVQKESAKLLTAYGNEINRLKTILVEHNISDGLH